MNKSNNIKRDMEIYKRRKYGEKFKSIAVDVGLSTGRIREIYRKLNKKGIMYYDWKSPLSIRNQNALRQLGVNTMAEIMDIRPQTFLRIRNYGIKSFIELQEMLRMYGYDWK